MAYSSLYEVVDRLLDGKLAETLTGWRDEGLSHTEIGYRLHSQYQVTVSHETIRRWAARAKDEVDEVKAS